MRESPCLETIRIFRVMIRIVLEIDRKGREMEP